MLLSLTRKRKSTRERLREIDSQTWSQRVTSSLLRLRPGLFGRKGWTSKRHVRELAQMSSALAHDFKGLLGSIKGYAWMLSSTPQGEAESACVEGIMEVSDRMMGMLNDLLDIAVLSDSPAGNLPPCDLLLSTETAISDLRGMALAKNVRVMLVVEGTPHNIRGDGTRLYRSVLNVIENAIKHAPANSQVTVTLTYGQRQVSLRVLDDGPGIAEEDLPYVFDRFYYSDKPTVSTASAGLGLAMVQATVLAHEGQVQARNHSGSGAEVLITLPNRQPPPR